MIGTVPFFGLSFAVTSDVLRPYRETELLVTTAINELDKGQRVFCDLGTGCGNIAISILRNVPHVRALATDISPAALDVARQNAIALGVIDRIDFLQADLAADILTESFPLVISNPPYCAPDEAARFEKLDIGPRGSFDGGADGLGLTRRILTEVPRIVSPNGVMIVELNNGTAEDVLSASVNSKTWRCAEVFKDRQGVGRCLKLRRFA